MASRQHAFQADVFFRAILSYPYSIHPMNSDGPEECIGLLNKYLFCEVFPMSGRCDYTNVASQYRELSDQAYRLYQRDLLIMQSIARSDDRRRSRFVLKAPCHTPFADVILRHFPNACRAYE